MIGYSKSRIAEFLKERGFIIQAQIYENGFDYSKIEIDEWDAKTFEKLTQIIREEPPTIITMNKEQEKTEQNSANPIPDITPNSEVPDIIIGAKED